jgi:hypothetical protein
MGLLQPDGCNEIVIAGFRKIGESCPIPKGRGRYEDVFEHCAMGYERCPLLKIEKGSVIFGEVIEVDSTVLYSEVPRLTVVTGWGTYGGFNYFCVFHCYPLIVRRKDLSTACEKMFL